MIRAARSSGGRTPSNGLNCVVRGVEFAAQLLGHILGRVDVLAEHDGVVALGEQLFDCLDQLTELAVLGALQFEGALGEALEASLFGRVVAVIADVGARRRVCGFLGLFVR